MSLDKTKTTFIYTLENPITKEIRYVGKTDNLSKRLKKHLKDTYRCKKVNWIKSLSSQNLKPDIICIDEVSYNEWEFWETFWIQMLKSWGCNLTNETNGGEGGNLFLNKHHSNQTKQKISKSLKGRKNVNCKRMGNKNGRYRKIKLNKLLLQYFIIDVENEMSQRKLSKKYNINRGTVIKYLSIIDELKNIAGSTGVGSCLVS